MTYNKNDKKWINKQRKSALNGTFSARPGSSQHPVRLRRNADKYALFRGIRRWTDKSCACNFLCRKRHAQVIVMWQYRDYLRRPEVCMFAWRRSRTAIFERSSTGSKGWDPLQVKPGSFRRWFLCLLICFSHHYAYLNSFFQNLNHFGISRCYLYVKPESIA